MNLIQIIKALGDENRLRILNVLKNGELCVCEIEKILDINQSNVSRHLNKLTVANLISSEKRALYVYYSLNQKTLEQHSFIKELLEKEMIRLSKYDNDMESLHNYRSSGLSCDDLKEGKACCIDTKED